MDLNDYLGETAALLARAASASLAEKMEAAITAVSDALGAGKPLLVCGNGGSASDAMHIAGELVGRYLKERSAYNVIALSADPAVLTAWANDHEYDTVFSRQVEAHGTDGAVLLAISTSGNSRNVVLALEAAHARNMTTVAMTGQGGGACAAHADILLDVPAGQTPRVQEIHICLYHFLCQEIEERLNSISNPPR